MTLLKVYFRLSLSPLLSPCLWLARTWWPRTRSATPSPPLIVLLSRLPLTTAPWLSHPGSVPLLICRSWDGLSRTECRSTCEEQNTLSVIPAHLCRPLTPRFPRKAFRHGVPAQSRGLICIMTVMNNSSRVIEWKMAPEMPLHASVDCVYS